DRAGQGDSERRGLTPPSEGARRGQAPPPAVLLGAASLPTLQPLPHPPISPLRPALPPVPGPLPPPAGAETPLHPLPPRPPRPPHPPRAGLAAPGAPLLPQLAGLFARGPPRGAQGITAGHVEQPRRVLRAKLAELLRGLRRLRVLALPRQDLHALHEQGLRRL